MDIIFLNDNSAEVVKQLEYDQTVAEYNVQKESTPLAAGRARFRARHHMHAARNHMRRSACRPPFEWMWAPAGCLVGWLVRLCTGGCAGRILQGT